MPKFNLINEQSATSMKLQQTLLSVSSRTTLAILVALSLSACGDSDLADLQAKSIESAIQAAAAQSENPLIDSDTPLIGEGNED